MELIEGGKKPKLLWSKFCYNVCLILPNCADLILLYNVAIRKEVHFELLIGVVKIACVNNGLCRCDATESLITVILGIVQ